MNEPETAAAGRAEPWPSLPQEAWQDTAATVHMWTQIIGKIRMALSPHLNHRWEVPLYVTARGLTTSPIPCGRRIFELKFDFIDHALCVSTSEGSRRQLAVALRSVADFYRELMGTLAELNIHVKIWPVPVEIAVPIPFGEDTQHDAYDAEYVQHF